MPRTHRPASESCQTEGASPGRDKSFPRVAEGRSPEPEESQEATTRVAVLAWQRSVLVPAPPRRCAWSWGCPPALLQQKQAGASGLSGMVTSRDLAQGAVTGGG